MARVPREQHARVLSAMQCLAMDCAEVSAALERVSVAILRMDAAAECAAIDELERAERFPSGDTDAEED